MIACKIRYDYGTNSWGIYTRPCIYTFNPDYTITNRKHYNIFGEVEEAAPSYLIDIEADTYGVALQRAKGILKDKVFPYLPSAYRIINEDQPEQPIWWISPINKHVVETILEVKPCWWYDNNDTYMIDVITPNYIYALDHAMEEIHNYKQGYIAAAPLQRNIVVVKER